MSDSSPPDNETARDILEGQFRAAHEKTRIGRAVQADIDDPTEGPPAPYDIDWNDPEDAKDIVRFVLEELAVLRHAVLSFADQLDPRGLRDEADYED